MTDDDGGRSHLRLIVQPPADAPAGPNAPEAPDRPASTPPERHEPATAATYPLGAWLSLHDLTGSVAMVTGSAAGLDLAIATALADFGARVVVAQRDIDRARVAARHSSRQAAGGAVAVGLDPSQPVQLRRGIGAIEHLTRRIDMLVVLADLEGLLRPDTTDALFMPDLVAIVRAVERRMAVVGGGRILVVAGGVPRDPAVGAMARGAISALVHAAAPDFSLAGVTINGVLSGPAMAPSGASQPEPGPRASAESETTAFGGTQVPAIPNVGADTTTSPTSPDDTGVISFPVATDPSATPPPADAMAAVISAMLGLIGPAMQRTTGQVITLGDH